MIRASRLFKTSTFRLSVVYMALLVLSVFTVLAYIYLNTTLLLDRQINETVEAEIVGLSEQYRSGGLRSLVQTVGERSRSSGGGVYLLRTSLGQRLAGNVSDMPQADGAGGWIEFTYIVPGPGEGVVHAAIARRFDLAGGFQLLVGRDIAALRRFDELIRSTLAVAVGLTILLGLGGGLMLSRGFLARIEQIGATSETIMAGHLSRRVPVSGAGDEIDRLAASLNAMLDEIERLMGVTRQVTDNIAHDLRTPLNRMRVRIEDVLRGDRGEAAYREALQVTLEECDRLIATFNALLSIARIEAGAGRDQFGDVDVAAVIADAAELYEPLAEERSIAFSVALAGGLIARGDRQLLGQAFANLIDNAMKYAGGGDRPAIAIYGERVGAQICITVADNGPGIAEPDRARVFSRFVRLERSRTEPGSGLGLSLVAAVARLHGGTARLDDNAPGLKATLWIPARPVAPTAPPLLPAPARGEPAASRPV